MQPPQKVFSVSAAAQPLIPAARLRVTLHLCSAGPEHDLTSENQSFRVTQVFVCVCARQGQPTHNISHFMHTSDSPGERCFLREQKRTEGRGERMNATRSQCVSVKVCRLSSGSGQAAQTEIRTAKTGERQLSLLIYSLVGASA